MRSSFSHHILLNLPSAASCIGSTVGELNYYFNNNPPEWMSLAEIYVLEGKKLKEGSHDAMWFNSPAACREPVLSKPFDELFHLIYMTLVHTADYDCMHSDFRLWVPLSQNLGGMVEALHLFNDKYQPYIGSPQAFLQKISKLNFFDLKR